MCPDTQSNDDVTQYEHFINGEFRSSGADNHIEVEYPYTGEVWSTVPDGTAEDVHAAISAARETFESDQWREMSRSERAAILRQIGEIFDTHTEELGRLETRQNGKLIREMEGQMGIIGDYYRFFAGLCETDDVGDVKPVENKDGQFFNYTRKEPLGVVGAITPWNSPLLLTTFKLAPALAAGNTFVHKPSEQTPVSALRFAELVAEETDLPDGAYNVVTGAGRTGAALSEHEDVDKLAFTGSTATGRKIGKIAGENLVPVSLELGGKSPNIVFPSANFENALNGTIKGIFAATGQTCLAGSRVLLHTDIAEEFVDQLTERAADIELGDPMDHDTEMGPVAFKGQWEKVRGYIEAGRDEGAEVVFGGERPEELPGECFIDPTILIDVENDMQVAREEIFGPVASVITFGDESEAIEIANDTEYGLAAGIWSENMRQAHRVAKRLEAGTVYVNEYRTLSRASPFGGYKDSGLGRELGREGLEEYQQTKSIWIDLEGHVADPFQIG